MNRRRALIDCINANRRLARWELLSLMEDLSEEHWCAGWLVDLEFVLWGKLCGNEHPKRMDVEEVEQLRTLSLAAEGWWVNAKGLDGDVEFVDLVEWQKIYKARGTTA